MQRHTVRRMAVATLLGGSLVLSACSNGAAEADGEGANSTQGSDNQVLTIAAPGVVSSLDSERYQGFISIDLLPNIAGTLVQFTKPEAGATQLQTPDEIEGQLAESWEANADGTEVTFTLRDVESPFGNKLTSEDVRWSIERMTKSEGVPIAQILMEVGGWNLDDPITVIDDKTFTINVAEPNAVSVSVLSTFFMMIYDSIEAKTHATEDDPFAYNWLAENSATYGVYHVESFNPGTEVRLVANENYHGEQPEIDTVVVRAVADGASRLQLVTSGEVHATSGLTFDQLEFLETESAVSLERTFYPNIDVLVPNLEVEPFDDPRVREALNLAVDREAILNSAYNGYGAVATDFFHGDFGIPEAETPLTRDLDRAKELLAEAGYGDGFAMELAYNPANLGAHSEQTAVFLRSQLAEVNIDVTLRNMASGADFDAAKRDGTLQAWLATSTPLVPDPAYYLQVFYATGGLTNQQNYSSPEVDDLSRQILETQPGDERNALVTAVNEFMVDDVPTVPLVDMQKFHVLNKDVSGFVPRLQGHIHFADLQFD